jgi:hypothetical protein
VRTTCVHNYFKNNLCVDFFLTTSCVHNFLCKHQVVCITFSIKMSCAHNLYIRKIVERRNKQENKKRKKRRAGDGRAAARQTMWSPPILLPHLLTKTT